MKAKCGLMAAALASILLTACATSGTRVTTNSDAYRDMAKSQQAWCGTFPDSCTCYVDGNRATCSLVYTCQAAGSCRAAP